MTKKRVPTTDEYRAENQPYDIDVIPVPEKQSTRSKVINWVVAGALVVIGLSLAVLLSWAYADENVLRVNNEPFPVRTIRNHPEPGGVVFLNIDLCKTTNVEGTIRTSFVSNTREVFLPLANEEMDKGCFVREIPVAIPSDLEPDTYRVKFSVRYSLNPLKQAVVDEFKSGEFVVDPRDL